MTNFIPILPLESVIYPGEVYRMHISKNQYKHLITDCFGENKPFGILPMFHNQHEGIGCLVEIDEVSEVWQDGRMNIQIKGLQVFRILEMIKEIPQKLYSGAIVSYPDNVTQTNPTMAMRVLQMLKEFHHLVQFNPNFSKPESHVNSYDMAHFAGLSYQEEFELLGLLFESQRLEYIRRNIVKVLPILQSIQTMHRRNAEDKDYKNPKGSNIEEE